MSQYILTIAYDFNVGNIVFKFYQNKDHKSIYRVSQCTGSINLLVKTIPNKFICEVLNQIKQILYCFVCN